MEVKQQKYYFLHANMSVATAKEIALKMFALTLRHTAQRTLYRHNCYHIMDVRLVISGFKNLVHFAAPSTLSSVMLLLSGSK
jgi:hypothetical protein